MNENQYWELIRMAQTELKRNHTEKSWSAYVEGITDFAYTICDYEAQERLERRLWIMWNAKRLEGMM